MNRIIVIIALIVSGLTLSGCSLSIADRTGPTYESGQKIYQGCPDGSNK